MALPIRSDDGKREGSSKPMLARLILASSDEVTVNAFFLRRFMPLYLPPLSRRKFLAGSVAAAAALVLGDALFGADERPEVDPHRFALLSDVHIAADPKAVLRGVTMADHLRSVVGEVAGLSLRPAAAAINGDLAL